MAGTARTPADPDLPALLGEIVADAKTLFGQQIDLFRAKAAQELRRAGGATGRLAAGGGLSAAAGLLTGFAVAHALRSATRLPLWTCFGLTAAGLGAGGAALIRSGSRTLGDARFLPKSTEALAENYQWLRDQTATA